jgi:hypothetical protein
MSKKDFWTSISQVQDAGGKDGRGGCLRRMAFNKIFKLPTPRKKVTIFGDVHHKVIERYLLADDRGLDAAGQPVNLYPDGWMSCTEKFGNDKTVYTVTPSEASLIQNLMNIAITEGYLIREPGRRIEMPIDRVLFVNDKGVKVVLKGAIDLDTPTRIEDHKTAKDTKYILSHAKLREDIQIMTYAYDKYERGHTGDLWLAQNNFIKDYDRPQVIKREILVTKPEVYQFFEDVTKPLLKKMFEVYLKYNQTDVSKWKEIAPASDTKECNWHYGKQCNFAGICSGSCSVAAYLSKFGQNMEHYVEMDINPQKGSKSIMSTLIDKIKAAHAKTAASVASAVTSAVSQAQTPPATPAQTAPAQSAPAAGTSVMDVIRRKQAEAAAAKAQEQTQPAAETAPVQASTPDPAPASAPAPDPLANKPRAPWYVMYEGTHCNACKDNEVLGFASNGDPCLICNARAKNQGRHTSECYDVDVKDGALVYTLKEGYAPQDNQKTSATLSVAQPGVGKVQTEMVPPKTETPPATPPQTQTTPAKTSKKAAKTNTAPEVVQATTISDGFTLLLGCAMVEKHSNGHVVLADQLLQEAIEAIAQTAGKDVSSIEHFALMGAIDAYVPAIVETVAGKVVVAFSPTKGSALARLIDGIRPFASTVIVPMGL